MNTMNNKANTVTSEFIKQATYEAVMEWIFVDEERLYFLVKNDLDYLYRKADYDEFKVDEDELDDVVIFGDLIDLLVEDIADEWDREEGYELTDGEKAYLKSLIKRMFNTGYGVDFDEEKIYFAPQKEGLYRYRFDEDEEYGYFFISNEKEHRLNRLFTLEQEDALTRYVLERQSVYIDSSELDDFKGKDIKETRKNFREALKCSELVLEGLDKTMFACWMEEGMPTCMDCGLPVLAWYRDGDCDRYRCEDCHRKAYTEEEWNKQCEEYEDECYYTDLL